MSDTPITFTEPSYALFDQDANGVLTTVWDTGAVLEVIAEAVAEEVARSAKALEFAGYLATAAEHYQSIVSRDADDDTDERADAWRVLSHALYEFRKRLARQQPAPDEAPTEE